MGISIMGSRRTDTGFTVAEMIVTIVVMVIFAGLLFQTYLTGLSQQSAVIWRSQADDIALTNLKKITTRTSSLVPACSAANDLTATPAGAGSSVAKASFGEESYGSLPSPHDQTLTVFYPRGCSVGTLVEIVSTVTYGTQSVSHASYVN